MITVERSPNESTSLFLRRFNKKLLESSLLKRARKFRYYERIMSKKLRKERALRSVARAKRMRQLYKMGKVQDNPRNKR